MKIKKILLACCLATLTSCTDTYKEYCTQYPVTFSCDISYPPYNVLNSMGQFLTLRFKSNHTGYILTNPFLGTTQEMALTEVEARNVLFGLGGLIVGQPYFNDGTSTIYAYDLACPNCDRSSARLEVDELGEAHCSHCENVYDLNNSGLVIEGQGRPLYRYRVTQSSVSTIYIHN